MSTTRESKAVRDERAEKAKEYLTDSHTYNFQPGSPVYAQVVDASRSGMTRWVQVFAIAPHNDGRAIINVSHNVALVIGARYDSGRRAVEVGGCGFDAAHDVVSSLSWALWPTYACLGEGNRECPSPDHHQGNQQARRAEFHRDGCALIYRSM